MAKKTTKYVNLTFTGRRNVIGPTTAKILAQGARMSRKLVKGLLGEDYQHKAKDILSSRFMVSPFSVLNTREGFWQQRKRQWIDIGIRSELGRGYDEEGAAYSGAGKPGELSARYRNSTLSQKYTDDPKGGLLRPPRVDLRDKSSVAGGGRKKHLIQGKDGVPLSQYYKHRDSSPGGSPRPAMAGRKWGDPIARGDSHGRPLIRPKADARSITLNDIDQYRNAAAGVEGDPIGGTSVFDPVLCELAYRWFAPPGGKVLDPFSGGSVRGIVAGELGLHYTGIDLSERQLKANRVQAETIGTDPVPEWICGDSLDVRALVKGEGTFDFMLSCPPYGDLERYSDDPRDLSTLPGEDFDDKYALIIAEACLMLKPNAFAVFVVGDYRNKDTGFYRNLPGVTTAAFEAAGLHLYNTAILVNVTGSLPLRINAQFTGSRKLGTTHQTVLVYARGQPKEFVKTWPPLEIV